MLAGLLSGGAQLLKTLLPGAINWGMNKLVTSNFGKKYVNPLVIQASHAINTPS